MRFRSFSRKHNINILVTVTVVVFDDEMVSAMCVTGCFEFET